MDVKIKFPELFTLLGIVLIVLKLLGKISISWLWVLAPFWGGFAVFLVFFAFLFLLAIFAAIIKR